MPASLSEAQQALTDYDEARADYMKFLSMSPPDDRAVEAAMVAMDEAHIRFKQAMGDRDAPTHLRPV
ncbi:MAG: hypothetical protein EOO54_00635 [Haliea sp.]|nr:MAG: hypothetical protein EOO54_00635 [Haliea sp.]